MKSSDHADNEYVLCGVRHSRVLEISSDESCIFDHFIQYICENHEIP